MLASPWLAIGLVLAIVALGFLVNRFTPTKRNQLRRGVILLALYLLALGLEHLTGLLPGSVAAWSPGLGVASEIFATFTLIHVVGFVFLDIALPKVGLELPTIVGDVAVGLAYLIAGMKQLGVDPSSILATSAVVTAVLALSLQTTLGNVLGGVALQLDDSIRRGDWVQLENGRQGKVREIRWRHTVLETRDWDTLIVPNAALLGATILVLGKRDGRDVPHRMWVYFHVDFRYRPTQVIEAVDRALQAAPIEGVAADPKPHCICHDFAKDLRDSYGYYAVRYYLTDLARDDPTSSLVRERIYVALQRAGIPLAIPAAHVFIEQDDAARKTRKNEQETARRMEALARLEFLRPLTDEERAGVAQHLVYAPFGRGETMTKQGAIAHWLYIVTSGSVRVLVTSEGRETEVAVLEAPTFFGEMGLLTGAPRTATIVAITDVTCYRLERSAFERILADRPEVAKEIAARLAERRVGLLSAQEQAGAGPPASLADEEKRIFDKVVSFFGLGRS